MYPPIVCTLCCRGLAAEYKIMIGYKKKFEAEIMKDNRFRAYGETVNFPLDACFDKLMLQGCCSTELMTKVDTVCELYGLPTIDIGSQ
jgi:hypothetical protein